MSTRAELLNFFKRSKFMLFFGIIYAGVVIVYLFFFLTVIPERVRLSKHKNNFYSTANKYLSERDTVSVNAKNLQVIFNSIDRESKGTLSKYGYVSLLEDYLRQIISDTNEENNKFYDPIFTILESEREQEPYLQLPPEERRILVNLENSVKNNDTQTALFNLTELNNVLRINNENLEKLRKQNRWSVPLAIVGLIITILFGILTVLRPISYRKIEKLVKK